MTGGILHEASAGRIPEKTQVEAAVRKFGFTGPLNFHGTLAGDDGDWDTQLSSLFTFPAFGENVGGDSTPERVRANLMDSPAHRENTLKPMYTHVGVGVARRADLSGRPMFVVTELFAHRPPPQEARQSADAIAEAILKYRAARRLRQPGFDAGLMEAAEAGIRSYVTTTPPSQTKAMQVAIRTLQSHVDRTRRNRPQVCVTIIEVLERPQLAQIPDLFDPRIEQLGVAVATIEGATPRMAVMMLLQGSFAAPVECKSPPR